MKSSIFKSSFFVSVLIFSLVTATAKSNQTDLGIFDSFTSKIYCFFNSNSLECKSFEEVKSLKKNGDFINTSTANTNNIDKTLSNTSNIPDQQLIDSIATLQKQLNDLKNDINNLNSDFNKKLNGVSQSASSQGSSGSQGQVGPQGPPGPIGIQGPKGEAAISSSFSGLQFIPVAGPAGPAGVAGTNGVSGTSGALSIGSTVTGATTGSVLFINPAGILSQNNSNFNWNNASNTLTIGSALDPIRIFSNASSTTDSDNLFIGEGAGNFSMTGINNYVIGRDSLKFNTTGNSNSAVGFGSLTSNTTGSLNTTLGVDSLFSNITGSGNIAVGARSLRSNIGGSNNSAVGLDSLRFNITGSSNSTLGVNSLFSNTFGSNNIAIGFAAGDNITTGSNNLIIGYDIDAPIATSSNQMSIGNLIFGTGIDGTGTTVSTGNIGIGTATPSNTLHVSQTATGTVARFTNSTGFCDIDPTTAALVCTSDVNLKKNILTINSSLDKVLSLNPVTFDWKLEDDSKGNHIGFIAQEVEKLFPYLVSADSKTGIKSLNHTGLIPLLVKSIQELNLKVEDLNKLSSQSTSTGSGQSIFANVGSSTLVNSTLQKSLNDLSLFVADPSTGSGQVASSTLANLETLFSTSSLASIKALTNSLLSNSDFNLNQNSLINVKAIQSASGNWSISQDGIITAKKIITETLCVGKSDNQTCVTKDQLDILLSNVQATSFKTQDAPSTSSEQATSTLIVPQLPVTQPSPEATAGTASNQQPESATTTSE